MRLTSLLYATTRPFPVAASQPLQLDVTFQDMPDNANGIYTGAKPIGVRSSYCNKLNVKSIKTPYLLWANMFRFLLLLLQLSMEITTFSLI